MELKMTSAKVYLLTVTILATSTGVVTQRYSDAEAVYSYVKNTSTSLRPLQNQSETLTVFVIISLNAVTKVDEVRQELSFNAWLNFSWTDQIRTWNKSDYGGLDLLHTDPTDIWRPRVMVSNSLQDRDIFKDQHSPMSLYWDGRASWYPGGVFHTSCKMDMTIFPFDTHVCSIRFLSNSYYVSELVFLPARAEVNRRGYRENGEWSLGQTEVETMTITIATEVFTGFQVTLTLSRRPAFFLLNVVLPIMLLSLLHSMMFVLPNNCGEKVTFGTTVLLSQAVYMSVVTDLLPQNSDSIPLMLVYLSSVLLLCSLALGLSILIVNIGDDNDDNNDNKPSLQEKDGISKPATDMDGFFAKRKVFPLDSQADEKYKEPATKPVKQESGRNAKRNLCVRFARLKGSTHCLVFLGVWLSMTLAFLVCGLSHNE